jgi:predicted amidohydrolase
MAANTAHFLEQCRLAGEAGVDLLCLPELMLVAGMAGKGDPAAVHAAALPLPGPWLEPFREVARAHRMGICFSVYERAGSAGEVVYNTALLLGRRGELIGTYRKVHLAIRESRAGIAAGHSFPVFEFDGVRVGMAICMDSTPAETARVLACQGAEVLLMPINGDFRATPWGRDRVEFHDDRWRLIQRAHAFDNHLYVVAARNDNRGSAITAPWGDILAYNDGDRDVIWADVDLDDRPAHYREGRLQSILWWMRRPPAYAPLTGDVVAAAARPAAPALETTSETV